MVNKLRERVFLLMIAALSLNAVNAEASSKREFKVMTGYDSSAAVLEGNYQEAIRLANSPQTNQTSYERAVNANSLCVAHAKMARVEDAMTACLKAVRLSRRVGAYTGLDTAAENNRRIVLKFANQAR